MFRDLKQKLVSLVLDLPRYEWWLHWSWNRICNRNEQLIAAPAQKAVMCNWQWTSDLHIAKIFPMLGTRLMRRALADWPLVFADAPLACSDPIQVSFVIGHRGTARTAHLLSSLATIAGQRGAACECIVVEQSTFPEIRELLPGWVRYIHTPLPVADMPYCRSWTLNAGARLARGKLLVLHDNDMLIPQVYAAELWARYLEGYKAINLKRFIFYLGEQHSLRVISSKTVCTDEPVGAVVQNLEAGGSVAIEREAFLAIGGFDESFVGWGGEDNEFWERAQTLNVWPYSYLPIVHLWHPPQPEKTKHDRVTAGYFERLSSIPPNKRIGELVKRKFGDTHQMDPVWSSHPPQI